DAECQRNFGAGHMSLLQIRSSSDERWPGVVPDGLQILGRLDDLFDEILADIDQRAVLREVARVDGRALRLDQVTFDGVTREVVDLDLAVATTAALLVVGGSNANECDQR